MAVPLLDLKRQHLPISEEINRAVAKVFEHNMFILGPEVSEFESKIAEYIGVKHAIGVASGTDALLIALRALGVGEGDEVITTVFTFFATAGVISRLGAKPVFVDIDPKTFNMNAELIEKAITDKTKAIMPVHLYGQCADMDPILEIARKHNLKVVEDAAQAIGSRYRGKMAGSMGDLGCFSFFPSKNLGACGDGGMIVTDDDDLEELCRKLRVHGAKPKYHHHIVGYNSRLDTLQAAILLVKLENLDSWHEGRRKWAKRYDEMFSSDKITVPYVEDYNYHIYHQYTIRVEKRDTLFQYLKANNIGCAIHYPMPLHLQECYIKKLDYPKGSFPEAEKIAQEVISLPVFPELTAEEHREVIEAIEGFYK